MYAALAVALAFGWQALAVRYDYGGNWTSLFCIGGKLMQPALLTTENLYRFPGYGYDGQYYHYVAHDPLFRKGLDHYIDAPRLRYRRILVPALAYLAAAGREPAIDKTLIATNLLFVFVGVYWLSSYVTHRGYHAAWGLLFLFVPAVVVGLDRLTVDLALTALAIGFVLYIAKDEPRKLFVVLLLAPLARETGLLLTAGYAISQLTRHRIKNALVYATSAAPALAWYAFVQVHTTAYGIAAWFTPIPLGGLIDRMIHPLPYRFTPAVAWTATALDELALAGMLLAFFISFWLLRAPWIRQIQFAIALMALSGLNLGKPFWEEAYAFGRVFSPLLALIALRRCSSGSWAPVWPLAMVVPRIVLQLGGQIVKIAQGLFT